MDQGGHKMILYDGIFAQVVPKPTRDLIRTHPNFSSPKSHLTNSRTNMVSTKLDQNKYFFSKLDARRLNFKIGKDFLGFLN